jgi:hypothetical protein
MARKATTDKARAMAASVADVNARTYVRGKLVEVLGVIPTDAQVDAAVKAGAWATSVPAPVVTGAATVKAPKAKAKTPDFILQRGANKAANMELAAAMRGAKVLPTGAPWAAAKAVLKAGGTLAHAVAAAMATPA